MAIEQNRIKKIWVVSNRIDLGEDTDLEHEPPISMTITDDLESESVQQVFRDTLDLSDDTLILKLRNSRGSLIPINCHIQANSKLVPYVIEVVRRYQNVQPRPKTVQMPNYNETMASKLSNIMKRIDKLEEMCPQLRNKRNEKIKKEMEELNEKMRFMNQRMRQAEAQKWKGMFKKHPLW
ncbi:uncharacterized protein [Ptychodera flava]|uniref:uncharacterized protein n=1 Tax=Ptychodera flava TaxID=63121 RepID=UPI003969FB05